MSLPGFKPKEIKLYTIISVAISVAIIVFILLFTVNANTLSYLAHAQIRYEYFLAAILTNIVSWFLWGARVKILSQGLDKKFKISWWESTKIVIAHLFFSDLTPSMVGGEPVRIYLLNKNGMNLGGATASVLGERLIDALFMLLCIPFALFILQDRINLGIIRTGIIAGIIVFVIFILLFMYAMKNPKKMKVFLCSLEQKMSKIFRRHKTRDHGRIIERINQEVDNFHSSIVLFVTEEKKAFLLAGLITILYWFVGFLIPSFILLGLGLPPYLIESYAAQMILVIIVLLPITPGGSGVAEGGMAVLYGAFIGGTHGYLLGVFVLLFRLISYHMNIIAGAVFQYRIFKSFTAYSFDSMRKKKK